MLAKRIIPCLDVDKGRVVKGINFINITDAGDPVDTAKIYDAQGADELVFLDITASYENRDILKNIVAKIAQEIFIPFTVGGGLRTIDDIREILSAGADKISINTSAVKNPDLIKQSAEVFGSQCIVVAIDAKRENSAHWQVYINGGRTPTGKDAVEWAKECEHLGAGEILLTSMDKDGTKDGFDIELIEKISSAVKIPVIASGGAGTAQHFIEVFKKTKATAGLAASIFHYGEIKINILKKILFDNNINMRIIEETQ